MIEKEDDFDPSEMYGGGRNGAFGFEKHDDESGPSRPFKDEAQSNLKFTKSLLQKRKGKGLQHYSRFLR